MENQKTKGKLQGNLKTIGRLQEKHETTGNRKGNHKKNKKEITTKGITKYTSYGFSYYLTKKFFIEAEKNRVLNNSFRFTKPLVLIHGLKDNVVEEDVPRKILKKVTGKNINIIYLKESDHRLSSETDLKMITQSIDYIQNLKNS